MPKFPEPPTPQELRRLPPAETSLPAGTLAWRLYRRGGRHPALWQTFRHFGPLNGRFDHHLAGTDGGPREQTRGIYYAALDIATCLAEVFQESRAIVRNGDDQPWLVGFELAMSVPLLDVSGTWPTRAGASMALTSGPRPRTRRWSRAIYDAYPEIQGLWSPSSMYANRPMVCLYERAREALPMHPRAHRPLNDPALLVALDRVAEEIGYDLV